ncbi:MAG: methylenetetrahydrofolate reductase [NAD(P)H] [Pseudomonadota bacterium]
MLDPIKNASRSLSGQDLKVSFEFFPPKTEKMEGTLWNSISQLAQLNPDFVSVTYGAGGSTRERTHATVARILRETHLKPAAHLTCVAATRKEVDDVVKSYWDVGVRHIVALRGDPPEGVGQTFQAHPEGYQSSIELIKGIKAIGDFEVSVSAYPEQHPESRNLDEDLDMLEAKVEAGATRAITQFFFDNDYYLRYLEAVRARGITIPIIPGLIPIYSFKQISKFAAQCGTTLPTWLAHRFEGLENDPDTCKLVATAVAAEQVMELADHGIRDFHFYTLNRAELVYAICHLLGMRAEEIEAV